MKTLSPTQIVEAMADNWTLSMIHFLRYLPTMKKITTFKNIHVVRSDISDASFNYVLRSKLGPTEALQTVKDIVDQFKQRNLPFAWYMEPGDTPQNLGEMLLNEGLIFFEENVGMYLEINTYPKKNKATLSFERVLTPRGLRDFDSVNIAIGESCHFDPIYQYLPPEAYGEGSPIEMYVGYKEGRPVATGIVVFHAGIAGIYYVATVPEERRKGYASEMMEWLFMRAEEQGYEIMALQASADGKFLYEHLGFRECCRFHEYDWEGKK